MAAKGKLIKPKRQMQNVKFSALEELLEFLPDDEKEIVDVLRDLIYNIEPLIKEKLSFSVPFFSMNKTICFIWPASVYWGSKKTFEGVQFGFTNGVLLDDRWNYMSLSGRKQMTLRTFKTSAEINISILKNLLHEALELDSIKDKKSYNS